MATLKKLFKNERGNVTIMTGVSMMVIVGAIGAAVDYSSANNLRSDTQGIADSVALNAAAFVREYDRAPTSADTDGLIAGSYTATQLGYTSLPNADSITFDLVYDMQAGEARVTARGAVPTTFSGAVGVKSLSVSTESTATFVEKAVRDVASIALVLDNSGSMAWDAEKAEYVNNTWQSPPGTKTRVEVLKGSVGAFMADLRDLVGSDTTQRVVRTGFAAFSGYNVSPVRSMAWQTMTDSELNSMQTTGGTYPQFALGQVNTWMSNEDSIHLQASGKTPLKYVIYVSDGANNQDNQQWVAESGTGKWRQDYRRRYQYRNSSSSSYWYSYSWYNFTRSATSNNKPDNYENGIWYSYFNNQERYQYDFESWIEGDWSRPTDDAVIAKCNDLKAQGVKIYTIGFALEPGKYMAGDSSYREIDQETADYAYSVLSDCATSNDTFIIAKDTADLEDAFETIGEDIMEEVIRVSS